MAFVIRTVEIHAIPTCRKEQIGSDASLAGTRREIASIGTSPGRRVDSSEISTETPKGGLLLIPGVLILSEEGIANKHSEALSKSWLVSTFYNDVGYGAEAGFRHLQLCHSPVRTP